MIATGKYIKKMDEKSKVVFIGPCTAKKSEGVRRSTDGAIDYVITFEELIALFDAFQVDLEGCSEEAVDDASIFGRGYGISGGLTAAIESYIKEAEIETQFKPIKVSGGVEIKKTMRRASIGKLEGNFIEGMMCEGGCINGAGAIVPEKRAKEVFNRSNLKAFKKTVLSNDKLEKYQEINLERD